MLRSYKLHIDACIDSKELARLLVEREFDIERHNLRYGEPRPCDTVWVPEVIREGSVVLTGDWGRGDRKMLDTLVAYRGRAILVPNKWQPKDTAARLYDLSQAIGAAFHREPLILWLSRERFTAARHDDLSRKYAVLGNGKLRELKR